MDQRNDGSNQPQQTLGGAAHPQNYHPNIIPCHNPTYGALPSMLSQRFYSSNQLKQGRQPQPSSRFHAQSVYGDARTGHLQAENYSRGSQHQIGTKRKENFSSPSTSAVKNKKDGSNVTNQCQRGFHNSGGYMGQQNLDELSGKVTFDAEYVDGLEMTVQVAEECLEEEFSDLKVDDQKATEKECFFNSDLKLAGTSRKGDFHPGEARNLAGLADLWRLKPTKEVTGASKVELSDFPIQTKLYSKGFSPIISHASGSENSAVEELRGSGKAVEGRSEELDAQNRLDESGKSRGECGIIEDDENFDKTIKRNKTNLYTWDDEFLTAALAEEFANEDKEKNEKDFNANSSEILLNILHQDLQHDEKLNKINENDEEIDEEDEKFDEEDNLDDVPSNWSGISPQGRKETTNKFKPSDAWEKALNKENLAEDLSESISAEDSESSSSSSDDEFHNFPPLIPEKVKINVLEGIDPKEWERKLLESGCKVYFIVKIKEPDDQLTEFKFSCLWEPETPIMILFELALTKQNIDRNDLKANEICLKHFSFGMPVECWIWMDARPESTYEMRLKRRT